MHEPAPALMVQGTTSAAGKSLLCVALCRILARQGLAVRPFKAQNMSNNAAVAIDGGEIGRAQALQAAAARVEPDPRMNPVLLKPLADTRCDVVVMGRSRPDLTRVPWHDRKVILWPCVLDALSSLRSEADVVVIEGAGSPAETNLRASDIVNMAVAHAADAAVLVVADIDRGGAFASLFGTWALLEDADRARISGFVLNRFRGDPSLLAPAPDELHTRTGVPVIGVVPYVRHQLPEEDAAGIRRDGAGARAGARIAALRFPHIANFDDLDPLAADPGVCVSWIDRPDELESAAAIVLPGTRNTLADLRWLWRTGLAAAIRSACGRGVPVVGICGGYQMLGNSVADPDGIEDGGSCPGLGLIGIETVLDAHKTTRRTEARIVADPPGLAGTPGLPLHGYEIHHGRTSVTGSASPWLLGSDGEPLGVHEGHAWGGYVHGLFEEDGLRRAFLDSLHVRTGTESWRLRLDHEIDRIADVVAANIDMAFVERLIRRQE